MSVRARRRAAKEYRRLLTKIFEFMFACGLVKKEIADVAMTALTHAKMINSASEREMSGSLATAALVLDAWHRDRRYLTASGRPRAVPLLGRAPSVEALIRSQPGRHQAVALARRLDSQHMLVACGRDRYKPASKIALLSDFDPLAIQHVARSVSMLLETIHQNLTGARTSRRLIERIAEVPDLPAQQVQAFRKFTQAQGWILLRTVNDWLEIRRSRNPSRDQKTVRAGIHVHTYVGGAQRLLRSSKSTRFTA